MMLKLLVPHGHILATFRRLRRNSDINYTRERTSTQKNFFTFYFPYRYNTYLGRRAFPSPVGHTHVCLENVYSEFAVSLLRFCKHHRG